MGRKKRDKKPKFQAKKINLIPSSADSKVAMKNMERNILLALVLLFVTVVVYIPTYDAGYIYDDDSLITQNPAIVRGKGFLDVESWKGLASFWFPSREVAADYFPLTSSMFWLEWRLWGNSDPGTPGYDLERAPGFHISNIALHAICGILLWIVLRRLAVPGAWLAALVWAVHPVCVESVAWIAERKNTLSMALFLTTMLSWLKYIRTEERHYYITTLIWFVLALLAKTAIVMVPFVLLLTVWWLRGSLSRRDLLHSVPFFIFSFILGCVTLKFQYDRAIGEEFIPFGTLFQRICNASFALGFYIYKIFAPFNLALIYPQWHWTVPWYLQVPPGVGYALVFYLAWKYRATWGRHVIFGLGFFVINLGPVLGLLKMAYMRLTLVADHFQYTPMVGVIALVVGAGVWWSERLKPELRALVVPAVAILLVGGCGWLSWNQSLIYNSPEKIWTDTLKKNPDSWQAHNHMGAILINRGEIDAALVHFLRGVELKPYNCEVHNNAGVAYAKKGQIDKALEHFKRAVEINGEIASIRSNYASWLRTAKRYAEAEENFRYMVNRFPKDPMLRVELGITLMEAGKYQEAEREGREVLRINPGMGQAQDLLNEVARRRKK